MRSQRVPRSALVAAALLLAPAAHAFPVGESSALGILLQPQLALDQAEEADGGGLGIDPHLHRITLSFEGSPSDKLSYYTQVGLEELGLNGDWSTPVSVQDAWLEWSPGPRLQVDAGLMRPPWAVLGLLRDGSSICVNEHQALLPYPAGSYGRDVGLQARGRILNGRLEYRVAGLAGVERAQGLEATDYDGDGTPDAPELNPDDIPRVTARLAWSFFDQLGGRGPDGYHTEGLVLEETDLGLRSPRKLLSAGVGIDHQQDALYVEHRDHTGSVASATRADYTAVVTDLLVDWPLRDGAHSLNVLLARTWMLMDEQHPAAGQGLLASAGYRIGSLQPTGSYELMDADAASAYDRAAARLGLVWWFDAGTRLQVEAGSLRVGGGNEQLFEGRLQAQLRF
jgi:hypothetical protein